MNRIDIDRIKHFSAESRGLWLGLFVPEYPNDPAGRAKHPLREWLSSDAHLTLLHLGKRRTGDDIETLCRILPEIWRPWSTPPVRDHVAGISAELTGAGWFWRRNEPTLVALVNSRDVFRLRSKVCQALADHEVFTSDGFGFIPHVTLGNENSIAGGPRRLAEELGKAPPLPFMFPALHVVCGEAKVVVE